MGGVMGSGYEEGYGVSVRWSKTWYGLAEESNMSDTNSIRYLIEA